MDRLNTLILRIRKNRFAQDSFWALLGNVAAKGMSLLGSIFVARFLGKEVFGEFGTIKSTLVSIAIFSTFGLGYTATKYIAEYRTNKPEVLRPLARRTMLITLVISSTMAVLLFGFADLLATEILKAGHLVGAIRLVAVWLIFNALTTTQIGILAGFRAFKTMARINTYVGISAFVTSVAFTYIWGLEGALMALLISQILNWYLNFRAVQNHLPESNQQIDNKLIQEILRYSTPVALQEGLYALTSWIMIVLLMHIGGYGEVGLYAAAMQWSAVLLFIPGILRNVMLTHFSETIHKSDQHNKVFVRSAWVNLASTVAPAIILIVGLPLIKILYGTDYEKLGTVLIIVAMSAIFLSQINVFTQAYLSLGKNWLMLALRTLRDLLAISAFLYFSYSWENKAIVLALCGLGANMIFLFLIWHFYKKFASKWSV